MFRVNDQTLQIRRGSSVMARNCVGSAVSYGTPTEHDGDCQRLSYFPLL